MLRNLIFDWSGTLVDDLAPVAEATNLILRHFGKPELLLEEFRERFCLPLETFYQEHLPEIALLEIEPLFHSHFVDRQNAIGLLPHAREFLDFARASGRRLFLLSTLKESQFAEQSARLGLASFFERAYVGVMDKRARIGEILAENGLRAAETAFIGDMVHDVESARQGGIMAIAVLTGFDSAAKLGRAGPDAIVRDLSALQQLLEAVSPNDAIRIEDLELFARVGVPVAERANPQRLTVSLRLEPRRSFARLADDLGQTIDYAAVCESLRQFVTGREDRLIETLADAIAGHVLEKFQAARVELELRKFILPETRFVAARVARTAL